MMKNKMMRLASVLLVAVLLSTCAISGTFAKYVTTASGTDTARVAKWGITMSNNGSDTFLAAYEDGNLTVQGTDTSIDADGDPDDVVAPGTTSTVTYSVSGAPETAYQITFKAEDIQEVFLGAETYTYDPPYEGMTQVVPGKYYPIKYTIEVVAGDGGVVTNAPSGVYATLTEALTALSGTTIDFPANKGGVTVTIKWNWAFDEGTDGDGLDQNAHIKNAYDTILGDLAAKKAGATTGLTTSATEGMDKDYNLTVAYKLIMTATQKD